jgi:hypothetical protein
MLGKIKKVGLGVAGAANSDSGTTAVPPTASGKPPPALREMPAQGTAAHEDHEKAVTGDEADKAKAAALEAVGGGSAGDVTTDYFGDGYEVTVTESGGNTVEVHLDNSFEVMGPPGGRGAAPPPPGWDN